MNRRLISVFLFAVVVASLTSYVLYRLILVRVRSDGQARALPANQLIVAKHDILVGAIIADGDLAAVAWGAPIPADAVRAPRDIVGRGAIATIYQNEPILMARLAPQGAGAGLAATIPVGMRAVALRVNDVVGLAGFVVPGMHVDILTVGNAPSADTARTGALSRTILQNIAVLSAGQNMDKTVNGKPEMAQVVNLLVTPAQAEILNLAMSEVKVQLVLRNPLDNQQQTPPGTSLAGLFGVAAAPAAQAPAQPRNIRVPSAAASPAPLPEVMHIETFNGMKKSEQTFDSPTGKK